MCVCVCTCLCVCVWECMCVYDPTAAVVWNARYIRSDRQVVRLYQQYVTS